MLDILRRTVGAGPHFFRLISDNLRCITSEIPLNFWKLLVIFLERTLVAIPLIVLFANMIGL